MPLVDGPFERGKCGYKLVQYMASGLPVVASPVGVNKDIVRPGWNGFLCETSEQWEEVLSRLISDAALRQKMGRNGAALARSHFSIEETASQYKGVIAAALPHPLQ
jgi:glycosyltransferase involved in cell wall biosynthesis